MYQKDDVIRALAGMWPEAIMQISGVDSRYFSGKHMDCPACQSGKDRFRFDDHFQTKHDGGAICSQCGASDGLGLLMKVSGMGYGEAITALGDWVGGVPVQRREAVRKEVVQKASQEKYGSYADHERCLAILNKCSVENKTPVSHFAGINPEPLLGFISPSKTPLIVVPVSLCGSVDMYCDVAFINPDHEVRFLSGGKPASGISIIPGTGQAIYLCADWFDSWHTHHATGAEVWCCWWPQNIGQVAHRSRGKTLRVSCHPADSESLIQADIAGLQVVMPRDGKWSMGIERKLYEPGSLEG